MAISTAKARPKWQACTRLSHPTWILSSAPYHTPMHGRDWLWAILALSRHLSRAPGVQKLFFMCSNSGHYGAQSPEKGTSPGKCPVCQNTTPKCEVAVRLGHSIWKVSPNDYLYGRNQIKIAGLLQARLSRLESVKCVISKPNAFPDTYPRL